MRLVERGRLIGEMEVGMTSGRGGCVKILETPRLMYLHAMCPTAVCFLIWVESSRREQNRMELEDVFD